FGFSTEWSAVMMRWAFPRASDQVRAAGVRGRGPGAAPVTLRAGLGASPKAREMAMASWFGFDGLVNGPLDTLRDVSGHRFDTTEHAPESSWMNFCTGSDYVNRNLIPGEFSPEIRGVRCSSHRGPMEPWATGTILRSVCSCAGVSSSCRGISSD